MFSQLSNEQSRHIIKFGITNEKAFLSMRKIQKEEKIVCKECEEIEKALKRKK